MSQPEITLWRAVILQQFIDAVMHAPSRYKRHDKAMAQQWLLNNSDGFKLVCDCADVSPVKVRVMARDLAASGWEHRKFNLGEPLAAGVFA